MQSATRASSSIFILLPLAALASCVAATTFAAQPDTAYESGFERCSAAAQYCADVDQDGYGDIGYCLTTCEKPYDFFALAPTDCNNNSALINPGAAETCNGLDDNCDGNIDEGDPGGGLACSTGLLGVCAAGVTQCSSGGLSCQQSVQPSEEICDAMDNDCNGVVDETFPELGAACSDGQPGICAGTGTFVCDVSKTATTCSITKPGSTPTAETCNGLDDNCDGTIDEGNPGGGAACDTGQPGVCAAGTVTCVSAALTCKPNATGC
jgi:hypothetical protein